jgi:hypothetical protein
MTTIKYENNDQREQTNKKKCNENKNNIKLFTVSSAFISLGQIKEVALMLRLRRIFYVVDVGQV